MCNKWRVLDTEKKIVSDKLTRECYFVMPRTQNGDWGKAALLGWKLKKGKLPAYAKRFWN